MIQQPVFAFSTLACPEWTTEEVVRRTASLGFDAIEWRGGTEGHVSVDWPSRRRAQLRRDMAEGGVAALAVTSYTDFVTGDARGRAGSVDHLRRHLELAADLGAPTVRAFIGIVDDDAAPATLVGRAVEGVEACVETARATGVAIAVEPHDDLATAAAIAPIVNRLDPSAVGVVWDIANAWGAGEQPTDGLAVVVDRIRYVQVKDARWEATVWRLTHLGEGDVPLAEALDGLAAAGPLPPLSLEWERAWHPELDPAEVALPRGLDALRRLASEATRDRG